MIAFPSSTIIGTYDTFLIFILNNTLFVSAVVCFEATVVGGDSYE